MGRSAVLSDTLWFDLCRRRHYWTDRLEQRDRRDAAAGQNERDSVDDDTLQETGHSRPQRRPQPRPKQQQQQQQQQARRRQGVARSKRQERRRPASEGMEAIPTKLDAAQWVMSMVAKQPHVMAILVVLLVLATSWMLADQEADNEPRPAVYGARPTGGGGGRRRARKGSDSVSIESPRSHAAIASRTQAERALALLLEGCPRSGQAEFCGAFRPQGVHRGFPHYTNSAGTHLYRHTGRQKWLISPYFTPEDDLSKVRTRSCSWSMSHR